MSLPDPILAQKSALRAAALAARDALPPERRAAAAEAIAGRELPVAVAPGLIVSGFFPMKSEINPIPLMRRFVAAGAQLALPAMVGKTAPLAMRAWGFGDPLKAGIWGIREPLPEAPEVWPDVVIAPLAAFDRAGNRIGYGGGYYDRTLTALRARKPVIAIGIAFAAQQVPRVPATERDAPLDLVLTEAETIHIGRA